MDKELQEYYENLLDLFTHKGWSQFIEDIEGNAEMLRDIMTIKDEQGFWYRRGQVEAVQRILSYESTIKDSYEDFERQADE
jgi:cellobiose phosphorylase